jgi:ABC-type amino acid transport substrate-binding protein
MMGVYGFVEQQVQTTKRVSFHKPRLMRYATGVEAFKTATNFGVASPSDEAENQMTLEQAMQKLKSNRIDYWILSKSQLVRTALPALPVAYENEGYVVYDVSQPLPLNTKSR